jgi:hypothetical protein
VIHRRSTGTKRCSLLIAGGCARTSFATLATDARRAAAVVGSTFTMPAGIGTWAGSDPKNFKRCVVTAVHGSGRGANAGWLKVLFWIVLTAIAIQLLSWLMVSITRGQGVW